MDRVCNHYKVSRSAIYLKEAPKVVMSKQQTEERIMFQLFIESALLPVKQGSIKSQPEPAPDILCEIQNRGPVAFELTEIVTPALAREFENGQRLKKAFIEALDTRPELSLNFSDAVIYVGFKTDLILQKILAVPKVVEELVKQPKTIRGDIPIPKKLQKLVSQISIDRGVVDGPGFDLMNMTKRTQEIFRQIDKKCTAKYSRDFPIELLAYYVTQPSSADFDWQSEEFNKFVRVRITNSPFERLWVFDNWCKAIKYVYSPTS
jgi:hypothetical protein